MATAEQFIAAARAYLGIRWHHMGRSRDGLDCIGLLLCAADDCGLQHDAVPPPYKRGAKGFDMFEACYRVGQPIPLNDARDGDILVFSDGMFPGHMGIRSTRDGHPAVIHARLDRRKVCEELLLHELSDNLRRAYRPFAFAEA